LADADAANASASSNPPTSRKQHLGARYGAATLYGGGSTVSKAVRLKFNARCA